MWTWRHRPWIYDLVYNQVFHWTTLLRPWFTYLLSGVTYNLSWVLPPTIMQKMGSFKLSYIGKYTA